jgi:hypothetical protein
MPTLAMPKGFKFVVMRAALEAARNPSLTDQIRSELLVLLETVPRCSDSPLARLLRDATGEPEDREAVVLSLFNMLVNSFAQDTPEELDRVGEKSGARYAGA